MASGKLEAIWLKRMKSGPMDAYSFTDLVANRGIAGNTNQGGKRQVTIIEKELWDELKTTLSETIEPKMRRANLMVSGIQLTNSRGKILRIGDCRIQIRGETRPCEQMDAAYPGLREVLKSDWRGGVFGEVLDNGVIAVGDPVSWDTTE